MKLKDEENRTEVEMCHMLALNLADLLQTLRVRKNLRRGKCSFAMGRAKQYVCFVETYGSKYGQPLGFGEFDRENLDDLLLKFTDFYEKNIKN